MAPDAEVVTPQERPRFSPQPHFDLRNASFCFVVWFHHLYHKNVADLHYGRPHTSFVGGLIKVQWQPERRGLERDREFDFLTCCWCSESFFHFLPRGLFNATGEFISFLTLRSQLSALSPHLAQPKFALHPPPSLCCNGELLHIKEPFNPAEKSLARTRGWRSWLKHPLCWRGGRAGW